MLSIAKKNRQALFAALEPNSIAIISSATIKYRSKDVQYPFRQNSDFWYLTAFSEPNALAIFIKPNHSANNQFILFHQRVDHIYKIWNGDLGSPKLITELFAADLDYYIDQIDDVLPELLVDKRIIYYPLNQDLDFLNFLSKSYQENLKISKEITKFKNDGGVYKDLLTIIHELRVFKNSLELEKIRYVTQVSAEAHKHLMYYVATNSNLTERDVHAEFYRYCLQHGCEDMAYSPIVAAGKNACILHYHKNSEPLKSGELLLIDAGAEYNYYAADITRVFPINGKFSNEQKAIYNLVLLAQQQAIKKIKPGVIWSNIQQEIIEVLVAGLKELKILFGKNSDLIASAAYKQFYMHGSGHFLGLDVHDVGNYKITEQSRPLVPGMVLTVEPGLYFSNNIDIASKWHGIGIRIEDDILVTEEGCEILTSMAIKEIDEIEDLMLN